MNTYIKLITFVIGIFLLGCESRPTPILAGEANISVGPTEVHFKWKGNRDSDCELIWGSLADINFYNYNLEDNITYLENLRPDTEYQARVRCDAIYTQTLKFKTLPRPKILEIDIEDKNSKVILTWKKPEDLNLTAYAIYLFEEKPFTKEKALRKIINKHSTQEINLLDNDKVYYISVAPIFTHVESQLEDVYTLNPILDIVQANDEINSSSANTLNLNVTEIDFNRVSFDWDDINYTTSYIVYLSKKSNFSLDKNITMQFETESESETSLDELDCGETYFIKIAGQDDFHIGPASTEYTFTLPLVVSPTTVLQTSVGNGNVTLTWTNQKIQGLSSYTLYVGEKENFTKEEAIKKIENAYSGITISDLLNNQIYYFALAPNIRQIECAKESSVSDIPKLDLTSSPIDTTKSEEEGTIWTEVNVSRQNAMIFWEKIPLATGYTIYLSKNKNIEYDANDTVVKHIKGIDTINTILRNLSYDQDYYFKINPKDTTHQGASEITYHFTIGEIDKIGKKLTKLNDTGVNENNNTLACASMSQWSDCKKALDVNGNIIPFGQDGFYMTGTKGRGKNLSLKGVCHRDDSSQLLWYEYDNKAKYSYFLNTDNNETENRLETACAIYDKDSQKYCNTLSLSMHLNNYIPNDCDCDTWRLPTRDELRNMTYYGKHLPSSYIINSKNNENLSSKGNYKTNMNESEYLYWSADIALIDSSFIISRNAWVINLLTGEEKIMPRNSNIRAVLVCSDIDK